MISAGILNAIGNTSMVRLHKVVLTGCANVLAAMKLGEKKGPEAVIVTLMVDSGLKYLSTVVYNK